MSGREQGSKRTGWREAGAAQRLRQHLDERAPEEDWPEATLDEVRHEADEAR